MRSVGPVLGWVAVLAMGLDGCGDEISAAREGERDETLKGDPYVAEIVDPELADLAGQALHPTESVDVRPLVTRFYEAYGDEYDFLYIITQSTVDTTVSGRNFTLDFPESDRLLSAIVLNYREHGSGPTLHETAHAWAVRLDDAHGFGDARGTSYAAHWGFAGVYGQLGGFRAETLRCLNPDGAEPPCAAEASGRTRYVVDEFGPNANGGDWVAYAPLELYLMGLITKEEVPSPIPVLDDAEVVDLGPIANTLVVEAQGLRTVTMDDIIATDGEVPLRAPSERAFRGAFVVFSSQRISSAQREVVSKWARVFAGDEASTLYSFDVATSGEATMDTLLGPKK